jgi:hypothetical protein
MLARRADMSLLHFECCPSSRELRPHGIMKSAGGSDWKKLESEEGVAIRGAGEKIGAAVLSWPGVTAQKHRFGGTELIYGERREIGHTHGDQMADIPFSTRMRAELVAAGRAEPHHILPETGWVSFYVRAEGDVERAIELFRLSYDLAVKQKQQTPA